MKKNKIDFGYILAVLFMILMFCFAGFVLMKQTMSEHELNQLMSQRSFELQKYNFNN